MHAQQKTYGPDVICPASGGNVQATHRPGNRGPFFCMCCGSTTHETVPAPAAS